MKSGAKPSTPMMLQASVMLIASMNTFAGGQTRQSDVYRHSKDDAPAVLATVTGAMSTVAPTRSGGTNATGAMRGDVGVGPLIYQNTLGTDLFRPSAGVFVADDVTTLFLTPSILGKYRVRVSGGVENGVGEFIAATSLYDACPDSLVGGQLIPGTTKLFANLADAADVFHTLEVDLTDRGICTDASLCSISEQDCIDGSACVFDSVIIPPTVWLQLRFSTSFAGVVFGEPAQVGSSEDAYDGPGILCSSNFGGWPESPHASFWIEMYAAPAPLCIQVCNDGVFCNGEEACNSIGECEPGVPPCPPSGVCDETTRECRCADDDYCADGMFCNGNEFCDGAGTCQAGEEACAPGLLCDEDTDQCLCDGDDDCDDALFCTGVETCGQDGICVPGDLLCPTVDLCDEITHECACAIDDHCSDGIFCNGSETCDAVGGCQPGTPPCPGSLTCDEQYDRCLCNSDADCDDGNDCTISRCSIISVCVYENVRSGTPCTSDGLFCTGEERCWSGDCLALDSPCQSPGLSCDAEAEARGTCSCAPGADCDDGLACNGIEVCNGAGACEQGAPLCPPDLLCRESDQSCVECLTSSDCSDSNPCTGTEICTESGSCETRVIADCNGNGLEDACDLAQGTSTDANANDRPDECDDADGELIYANTLGDIQFRPGAGARVADDLSTLLEASGTLGKFRIRVTGGVPGGGGEFLAETQLYDGCPDSSVGGQPIPGTSTLFRGLVDDADVFHDLDTDFSDRGTCEDGSACSVAQQTCGNGSPCTFDPLIIPPTVWLRIRVNTNQARILVGAPAQVGHSEDAYDNVYGDCTNDFGGWPENAHASFWIEVYALPPQSCETDDECDDGVYCNGQEFCDPDGYCQFGVPPCDEEKGCDESVDRCYCNDDGICDDLDPCTGIESCGPEGVCISTLRFDCNQNGVEDACDVPPIGDAFDCNANAVPDECELRDRLFGANDVWAMEFDLNTGAGAPVSGIGLRGFQSVRGLAYDWWTETFYGVDDLANQLVRIDPESGTVTRIGTLNFESVRGLAFDLNSSVLYGIDTSSNQLLTVDIATGAGTPVGSLGAEGAGVTGLAFDRFDGVLYGSKTLSTGMLVTINPSTGAATEVGLLGFGYVEGLAFDAVRDALYGCDLQTNTLLRIDTTTGEAAPIGRLLADATSSGLAYDDRNHKLLVSHVYPGRLMEIDLALSAGEEIGSLGDHAGDALAFDPNTNTLYGADAQRDELIAIDVLTGAAYTIGPIGFTNVQAIAFAPDTGVLYGVNSLTTDEQLITIDVATGAGHLVRSLPAGNITGMTYKNGRLYAYDSLSDEIVSFSVGGFMFVVSGQVGFQYSALRNLTFDEIRGTLLATADDDLIEIESNGAGVPLLSLDIPALTGLAFDPNTNTLYGAGASRLYKLTTSTAPETQRLSLGFSSMSGLAYDPNTKSLYAVNDKIDQLVHIDPITGLGTAIGPVGFDEVCSLAFDPITNVLFGTDADTDHLLTIDTGTGDATSVGPLGFASVCALAFDPQSGTLYGADAATGVLLVIDTAKGAGALVGSLDSYEMDGLAFDDAAGMLYGLSESNRETYRIDPATASVTRVGGVGFFQTKALAYAPNEDVLYGTSRYSLLTIDRDSGAGTTVGILPLDRIQGMAFDHNTGTVYAADELLRRLTSIDAATGSATFLRTYGFPYLAALTFDTKRDLLYGSTGSTLVSMEPSTGVDRTIGPFGTNVGALSYDEITDKLYGTTFNTNELVEVNKTTGDIAPIGSVGFGAVDELAFDPGAGQLYGVDLATDQLLSIDTTSGAASPIGMTSLFHVRGLAFVSGGGVDCNGNLVPDCSMLEENDCNENQHPDECELTIEANDCNVNEILDVCEIVGKGDFDDDGLLTMLDHSYLTSCLQGPGNATPCSGLCADAFDGDDDGDVDLQDAAAFMRLFSLE